MDERARGFIEKMIDDMVEKGDLVGVLGWIEEETPISSFRDLALGYMIGGVMAIAPALVFLWGERFTDEDKLEMREIIRRRLPEFIQRIERELGR